MQYADDLDFLSKVVSHLKKMLEIAQDVLPEWQLDTNDTKTDMIRVFRQPAVKQQPVVHQLHHQYRKMLQRQ